VNPVDLTLLGIGSGLAALTLTRSHFIRPLQARLRPYPWLHEGSNCPYCMAHWCGLAASLTLGGGFIPYLLNSLAIIGIAVLFQGLVQRLWFLQELEIQRLRGLLAEAAKAMKEAEKHETEN
jgi:hypothetical protein